MGFDEVYNIALQDLWARKAQIDRKYENGSVKDWELEIKASLDAMVEELPSADTQSFKQLVLIRKEELTNLTERIKSPVGPLSYGQSERLGMLSEQAKRLSDLYKL